MKITEAETSFLGFTKRLYQIHKASKGVCKIHLRIVKTGVKTSFSITWVFNYIINHEVYIEIAETRFLYQNYDKVEQDFQDLKEFLNGCIDSLQNDLLQRYWKLEFPEIDLEVLTCEVLEKIILNDL